MTHDLPLRLSVAAPAYNEEDNVAAAVREWRDHLDASPGVGEWEIVVCDDGSSDATAVRLKALQAEVPQLVVVGHPVNRGAGAAIASAIAATRLDWVLLLDSDRQFPIAGLEGFLAAIRRGPVAAAYSGARDQKADSLLHRFGSWSSGVVGNLLHRSHYRDFNSVFKLVEGDLMRSLRLESVGVNCSTEITSQVHERGLRWVEVPIAHRARTEGQRSWRFVYGARQRALFLGYLGVRQALIGLRVLRRPDVPAAVEELRR